MVLLSDCSVWFYDVGYRIDSSDMICITRSLNPKMLTKHSDKIQS